MEEKSSTIQGRQYPETKAPKPRFRKGAKQKM